MADLRHVTTERLRLDAPTPDDLQALHEIYSDPRVWTHFPSLRHTDVGGDPRDARGVDRGLTVRAGPVDGPRA